jgi:hypothetical protein
MCPCKSGPALKLKPYYIVNASDLNGLTVTLLIVAYNAKSAQIGQ